jgi:hypothetical protein
LLGRAQQFKIGAQVLRGVALNLQSESS